MGISNGFGKRKKKEGRKKKEKEVEK